MYNYSYAQDCMQPLLLVTSFQIDEKIIDSRPNVLKEDRVGSQASYSADSLSSMHLLKV